MPEQQQHEIRQISHAMLDGMLATAVLRGVKFGRAPHTLLLPAELGLPDSLPACHGALQSSKGPAAQRCIGFDGLGEIERGGILQRQQQWQHGQRGRQSLVKHATASATWNMEHMRVDLHAGIDSGITTEYETQLCSHTANMQPNLKGLFLCALHDDGVSAVAEVEVSAYLLATDTLSQHYLLGLQLARVQIVPLCLCS